MDNHNVEKKIAVINDVTGFGRCGAMVSVPVISASGLQCCVVPTSIFSNHTAFSSFFMEDYTDKMESYVGEWKKLGLLFDGILTGFYGSERQIDIVCRFIDEFKGHDTIVTVDPIMGDNGKRYSTYTESMCAKMTQLVGKADIITPNVTESCILTGMEYKRNYTLFELEKMCHELSVMGPESIVITGIEDSDNIGNFVWSKGSGDMLVMPRRGKQRCGTGDIFSSIVAAESVRGKNLWEASVKAASFIGDCIEESDRINMPVTDGVCFEKFLNRLWED